MIPMVHLNAVLAIRGNWMFLQALHFSCASFSIGFDELLEKMPSLLPGALRSTHEGLTSISERSTEVGVALERLRPLGKQTALLAGWSVDRCRMIVRTYTLDDPGGEFVSEDWDTNYLAPWDSSLPEIPLPPDPQQIGRLANAQIQLLRSKAPGAAGGGLLICATIGRYGMTISPICGLPAVRHSPEPIK